ncbi:MAG TPA: hypothetical protein VET27_20820 [Mycobacterium sp.]|nr:hypothetical protein [Mycobacterium sp.]
MVSAVGRSAHLRHQLAQLVGSERVAPFGRFFDLIVCTSRTGLLPSTFAITASWRAP